jgi:hypothetical protein
MEQDARERAAREAREFEDRQRNAPRPQVVQEQQPDGSVRSVVRMIGPQTTDGTVLSTAPARPREQRQTDRGIEEFNPQTQQWEPTGRQPYRPPVGGGAPLPVQPVTVRRNGRDVVIDARSGREIGEAPPRDGGPAKPLPAAIQKMVQENIDIIGTAGSINADLAGITQQIEKGTLRFNPASNLVARARNATGLGNEQTANFASFRSNMERLRNESLRLNKGVQTDGDAQRAWNELFDNINDQGVVSQRLAEIQKINERAMALRGMDVERIYGEFGRQAPDLSRYGNLPGATNLPKSGSPNLPQIVPPQRPAANSAQPGGAPRVVDFSSLPQ